MKVCFEYPMLVVTVRISAKRYQVFLQTFDWCLVAPLNNDALISTVIMVEL
jgi:hypothetical protein